MGGGDWNDGMNRVGIEGKGESVWLAWFLLSILRAVRRARGARGRYAIAPRPTGAHAERLAQAVEECAGTGQWYRRAYFDDGTPLGSAAERRMPHRRDRAVLGGDLRRRRSAARAPGDGSARRAPGAARRAAWSCCLTPPFDRTIPDPGYIKGYVPGVRENGGQYTHAALWTVLAFARMGDGDRAAESSRC